MPSRIEQLTKLYETDPSDPFVTYGLGMEHMKQGHADDALHWLDKTLALDEGYSYAYYQKAKALQAMGQTDDARAAIRKGIDVAQAAGDGKAVSELTDLLEMMG